MQNIVYLLTRVIDIYTIVLIIRAVISWVQPNPDNPIIQFLYRITEPVLFPIRRTLLRYRSMRNTGIDFSPLVAIILLYVVKSVLIRML